MPVSARARACLTLLFAATSLCAAGDGHPLPLWRVAGAHNSIYLLGSIHLLRSSDHPVPDAIYDAYAHADVLVMELDMDDLDPLADQALVSELGLIRDSRTLRDFMGEAKYAETESLANALQIPMALLEQAEPWYAAISVEVLMLMRAGFNQADGIEAHLSGFAARDRKEIRGLETTREQLELLDGLSLDTQREMLLQALTESMDLANLMDDLIAAWRHGDLDFLEKNLLADMQGQPELHKVIVVERNHNWVGQIEELLDDNDDYLIVVGTLHLVGDDGVPNLLAALGYEVAQLSQPGDPR
jgi:hypothetical protein